MARKGVLTAGNVVTAKVSRRNGFTLIELLVVISIIAMLLAILMPALGKVKDKARSVVCRTRLKQMGVAFMLYGQENNDEFVMNEPVWGVPDAYWFYRISQYLDDVDGRDRLGGFLRCPSGRAIREYKDQAILKWNSIDYNVHKLDAQVLNPGLNVASGTYPPPMRLSQIKQASRCTAAFDFYHGEEADGTNIAHSPGTVGKYFWDKIMDNDEFPQRREKVLRHDGNLNAVYIDGSVGKINDPQWYEDMHPWPDPDRGAAE
ncbi:MAG: type II secretion system protein [Anaerohalosphaera sp.]|nr:type II secretion system protein [Anaerohalosphaera sp.]